MKLSKLEIEYRDKMITDGLKECKSLIGKQKSRKMYFFYEGSLEGLEECRNIDCLKAYTKRLDELKSDEHREISCSGLRRDSEDTKMLRESLRIYGDETTDLDRVWKIKGTRTQIEFVYERLIAFNLLTTKRSVLV